MNTAGGNGNSVAIAVIILIISIVSIIFSIKTLIDLHSLEKETEELRVKTREMLRQAEDIYEANRRYGDLRKKLVEMARGHKRVQTESTIKRL